MTDFLRIDPTKTYEIKNTAYPLLSARVVIGVANDQAVVTLTAAQIAAGQVVAVMGWTNHSAGAAAIVFKNGAAGTALRSTQLQAAINDHLELVDKIYFQTTAGTSLVCDVTTATVAININYIIYTP